MASKKLNEADVTIIIVNWNTRQMTCDCLASIYQETNNLVFEIIVVDNNSSDDSVSKIKERFPDVILIENSDNRGFAAANNQGMLKAKGDFILLLNSDTLILDNAVEKVHSFIKSNPDVGVVGCKVLNHDKSLQLSCFMLPSLVNKLLFATGLYKMFPRSKIFGREWLTWWDRNDIREVEVVTGCFMYIRRKVIDKVGGFDERFFMYSEEVDLCLRIMKNNWKILFYPDAQIIHFGGASAAKYGAKRAKVKDASEIKYIFKHWPAWKRFAFMFILMCFYISRIIIVLPLYMVTRKKRYSKILANHFVGLTSLFCYKRYLNTDYKGI